MNMREKQVDRQVYRRSKRKSAKSNFLSCKPDAHGRQRRRCKPVRIGKEINKVIYWSPFNILAGVDAEGKRLPSVFLEILQGM